MTRLAAKLPGGDQDGLQSIGRQLIDAPHEGRLVVAMLDCKSITTDNDTGDVIPTARILHVEPVRDEDYETARKLLDAAHSKRTGNLTMRFDVTTGESDGP